MVITPQTNIKLLKVPFEMDNNNQLTFSNATAQYNYFNGLTNKIEYDNCTYQRKDGYMAINEDADTLQSYNYCMYQNEQYGNKWFYAFITNVTYEGNEVSYVYIKTDVFQTWQFDIVWKRSFVEREHVNDDTIGLHTVPENLETGEYVNCTTPFQPVTLTSAYTVIAVTEIIWIPDSATAHSKYNGVAGALTFLIVKDMASLDSIIYLYNRAGKIEAINCVFMIPTEFEANPSWQTETETSAQYAYVSSRTGAYILSVINVSVPTTLANSYTPKNNKLLCYPYRYMLCTNSAGTDAVYRYEEFEYFNQSPAGICNFSLYGTISPGCSLRLIPKDYKKVTGDNNEEGINLAKFPIGSWINDPYANWLRQESLNIRASYLSNAFQILGGTAMLSNPATAMAGAGTLSSGLLGVINSTAEMYKHALIPNQAEGNTNSSDIMFALNKMSPIFYHMSIKPEYSAIIDNFFTMYGYKVNTLKIPNITGRSNWNYVKTIGCNIVGDIPQKDLQELKSMFDAGVTLWHNASTFLDYSQTNNIV